MLHDAIGLAGFISIIIVGAYSLSQCFILPFSGWGSKLLVYSWRHFPTPTGFPSEASCTSWSILDYLDCACDWEGPCVCPVHSKCCIFYS